MGYVLAELFMIAVEIYFWCMGDKKPLPKEKPLPKIVGSVPYVPLRTRLSSDR
jgi:hypothetical protein